MNLRNQSVVSVRKLSKTNHKSQGQPKKAVNAPIFYIHFNV